MTSLAARAHTTPAPPPFNATLYATAATVIPVLFLAIAVQGRAYENLLKTFSAMDRRWPGPGRWYQQASAAIASMGLFATAGLILLYGVLSEADAVYALYQQQARSGTADNVLSGTILMTIAAAAGPAGAFLKALANVAWPLSTARVAQDAATTRHASPAPEPASTTATPAESETGKRDAEH